MLVAGVTAPLAGQKAATPEPTLLQQAAALQASGDWAGAANLYQAITEAEPENGAAFFGLGRALYDTRRVDPAITAYEKALELGFRPSASVLQLARAHAAKGDDGKALEWLSRVSQVGPSIYPAIAATEEFRRLENNETFQQIVAAVKPCNSPAYKQLDFWVGTWDVGSLETQQLAGRNTIAKILGGCALIENWTGAAGNEGKSLFYFDDSRQTWKQVWITDSQSIKEKHLIARYDNGAVRFQGETRGADGSHVLDRTTLAPLSENRVQQIIEQSRDGGETWQKTFDAVYVRVGTDG